MDLLTFALLGMGVGAIYGIVAQGLVLVYRASGILNFAQSGFLMIGAYIFYELHVLDGWPYWAALAAAMLACAAMGAAVHLLVLRPMREASAVARLIATLGVLGVLSSVASIVYQGNTASVPSSLPVTSVSVLPGVRIGLNIIILFGIGVAVTAVLWLFYRYSSFGRITSAVAENQLAASVTGHSPDTVAAVNWAIGAALAAFAGALIAPIDYLQSGTLVLLIVPAIGAGLAGSFLSFPLALAGGIVLGMAQSVVSLYVTTPGWSLSIPYILIVGYLMIRGRGIPLRSFVIDRLPKVGSGRVRPPVAAVLTAVMAAALIVVPPEWSAALTVTLAFAVIALSVVVITGYAGQLSLAQYILAGVGALAAARLSANWHFPFLAALLGALIITAALGALLALPSLRARGVSLAVATLAAGMVIFDLILNNYTLSGGQNGVTQASPDVFGWSIDPTLHPARYGITVLLVLVLLALAVANIRRGDAGRRMLAVRSNERAAAALGVHVYAAKVYAFTVAAGIAGVGGMLYAFLSPAVTSGNFDLLTSINFVTVTVVGGVGNIFGAVIGATMMPSGVVTQIFFSVQNINAWIPLAGSVGLLMVLRRNPSGLFELNSRLLLRLSRRIRPARSASTGRGTSQHGDRARLLARDAAENAAAAADDQMTPLARRKTLRVEDLRVTFGGVVAVDGVTITVRPGEVHGLIGPNGAGKTTFIDAVTGFVPLAAGRILVDDTDVTRWGARKRARHGVARTFQSLELFDDLTVRENLAVGADDGDAFRYLSDIVRPSRPRLRPLVLAALRESGLEDTLDVPPSSLPFGRRRMIAIMRALASDPAVLLLDEPAAGLSDPESEALGRLIRELATARQIAVLLIEHNLDMVAAVSDRMTVLASGSILAEGTPADVLAHPGVLETYVGDFAAPEGIA
jgi:ABC-type branched-subunit amino acid transport system ATPase component/branched-subunit amino acid ABC-type transport system permease component